MKLSIFYAAAAVTLLVVQCRGQDDSEESELPESQQHLLSNSEGEPIMEERRFCKISKKCMSMNGRCIPKDQKCDGEIVKKGCKKTKNCRLKYVCCAPVPTSAPTTTPDPNPAIISSDDFLSKFNKKYANEEEKKKRVAIFKENVKAMEDHNKQYESGKSSFLMGVNKYSDLTYDEVVSDLTGSKEYNESVRSLYEIYTPIHLGWEPRYLDYRGAGAVNPIRDQGQCGSCWAYSAIGSIESNIYLKTGVLQELSEQELNDCTYGCDGGWAHYAIEYVANKGISYRSEYPYTGRDDTCRGGLRKTPYKVIGIRRTGYGNDAELLNALAHYGPISVSVYVTSNFQGYRSGVLVDDLCTGVTWPNHAVVLVGYGTENGIDYWLIRNSWGESWGENGYIKLSRHVLNHCLISTYGFFPIIEDSTINPNLNWLSVGSERFVRFPQEMNWFDARKLCQANGLDLFEPKNIQAVAIYLEDNFSDSWYWVGSRGNGTHVVWLSGGVIPRSAPWYSNYYTQVGTDKCTEIITWYGMSRAGTILAPVDCSARTNIDVLCG